ncbi:unnamed protein product [Anisakis simplex]|uniref:FERM domain-containing protein n=1 Tax=Anisakis simplex TaxID=6269 RepID=A0A0M3JIG6_ANISI|nr:unnamed protein product [Anisakis simplex]
MSERRQQQTPSPFHRLSTSDAEETSQLTAKVLFRETRPDEAPFLKKSVPVRDYSAFRFDLKV